MGHRSWLVEVKNFDDVRDCTDFIGHANEICEYETFAQLSALIKFQGKIFLGWDSDIFLDLQRATRQANQFSIGKRIFKGN